MIQLSCSRCGKEMKLLPIDCEAPCYFCPECDAESKLVQIPERHENSKAEPQRKVSGKVSATVTAMATWFRHQKPPSREHEVLASPKSVQSERRAPRNTHIAVANAAAAREKVSDAMPQVHSYRVTLPYREPIYELYAGGPRYFSAVMLINAPCEKEALAGALHQFRELERLSSVSWHREIQEVGILVEKMR